LLVRIHQLPLDASGSDFEMLIRQIQADLGIPKGTIMLALRLITTGTKIGATLHETLHVLGKDTVLARLRMALNL
jgi:glutamyl/glutaminyl-tRNA synthetase